jgi:hypothetical protein
METVIPPQLRRGVRRVSTVRKAQLPLKQKCRF